MSTQLERAEDKINVAHKLLAQALYEVKINNDLTSTLPKGAVRLICVADDVLCGVREPSEGRRILRERIAELAP